MRPLLMLLISCTVSGWIGTPAAWAASSEGEDVLDAAAPADTRGIGCRASSRTSPLVIRGKASITGGLSLEQFHKVERLWFPSIKTCYARELNKNPTLTGKLEFQFLISNDGSVSYLSIEEDTMGVDHGLGACIEARISRWTFPAFEEGHALVNFPLIFGPPQESPTEQQ